MTVPELIKILEWADPLLEVQDGLRFSSGGKQVGVLKTELRNGEQVAFIELTDGAIQFLHNGEL